MDSPEAKGPDPNGRVSHDLSRNSGYPLLGAMGEIFLIVMMALGSGWTCWYMADAMLPYPEDRHVGLPSTLEQLKDQAGIFQQMVDTRWWAVTLVYSCLYIWKQTFAIPGSGLLNILGGVLFGFKGFLLVCFLTAIGATCCYMVSRTFGSKIVSYINDRHPSATRGGFASRWRGLQRAIAREDLKGNLLMYLLVLRIFPFTPQWLLNIASPHAGVSVPKFFVTALIGLLPYNFMTTQAGTVIGNMSTLSDAITMRSIGTLFMVALVPVALMLFKRKLNHGFDEGFQSNQTVVKKRSFHTVQSTRLRGAHSSHNAPP